MQLSDVSIRRPVLATVMSLMIVLIGIVGASRLTVREYPNIDAPVVTVQVNYPGASAEIMESQITTPLEETLSGIEGIEYMNSISRPEQTQITIEFKIERDADDAASDVRDRVSRTRGRLPEEIDEPIVAKVEADAQPIMWLAVSSATLPDLEVSDIADRIVRDRLQTLPGVADIRVVGERRYAMRIWLDPLKLAGYGITVQDVENALRRQNVEIPSGRIEAEAREFTVLAETDLRTEAQFRDIIVRETAGHLVKLHDIARVSLGAQDDRRFARYMGRKAVTLGVIKQSVANPLDVSRAVHEALPQIRQQMPEAANVEVSYDSSLFIEASITSVIHTFGEAILLVTLVIFLFLGSLRAALIPLVTIPISLIGAFAMMYALGFSINTLTLLALVLAIGLVVDDAIVVLENIYRHREEGKSGLEAAFTGMREVGFAVVAMTLTLAAVFLPVAFTPGKTGKLFTEFALALAGAVVVSGFVALTLSPMMCSRMLKVGERKGWQTRLEHGLEALDRGYRRALGWVLSHGLMLGAAGIVIAGLTGVFVKTLKSELSPVEDRGSIIAVALGPEGASPEYVDRYAREIEAVYATVPEAERYLAIVGFPLSNQALTIAVLKDWKARTVSQMSIVSGLRGPIGAVPGVMAFPTNRPSLGQSALSKPVSFVVQTSRSYPELERMVQALIDKAREHPAFANLDTDLKLNKPELKVQVNREKAATLGIPVETIGRTLETLLGSRQVTRFKREGKQYDVMVQIDDAYRTTPEQLKAIYVTSAAGELVPLSNLVTLTETVAPRELNHFNKLRAATLTATLNEGHALGEALAFLEEQARTLDPAPTSVDFSGQSREYKLQSASLAVTFLLALLFIYLVLSAQFESFISPFIILLTVPLATTGALATLWAFGGSLNLYSQIGLVTLIGLVTKNGILIVEFANQMRDTGKALRDAVMEAAVLRLRPILMTTSATVLGAIPLALASGAGAEARQQIGLVIVGGLTVGTVLTLFLIPLAYLAVNHLLGRRNAPAEMRAAQ